MQTLPNSKYTADADSVCGFMGGGGHVLACCWHAMLSNACTCGLACDTVHCMRVRGEGVFNDSVTGRSAISGVSGDGLVQSPPATYTADDPLNPLNH